VAIAVTNPWDWYAKTFEEVEHPRDPHGRWRRKPGASPPWVQELKPWEMTRAEFEEHPRTLWHGTIYGGLEDQRTGYSGVHVGSYEAAREALAARSGWDLGPRGSLADRQKLAYDYLAKWAGTPTRHDDGTITFEHDYGPYSRVGKTSSRLRFDGDEINVQDIYQERGANFDRLTWLERAAKKAGLGLRVEGRLLQEPWDGRPRKHTSTGVLAMDPGGKPPVPSTRPTLVPLWIVGPMSNTPEHPMTDEQANGIMAAMLRRGKARRGYYYRNISEDEGSISAAVPSRAHLRTHEDFLLEAHGYKDVPFVESEHPRSPAGRFVDKPEVLRVAARLGEEFAKLRQLKPDAEDAQVRSVYSERPEQPVIKRFLEKEKPQVLVDAATMLIQALARERGKLGAERLLREDKLRADGVGYEGRRTDPALVKLEEAEAPFTWQIVDLRRDLQPTAQKLGPGAAKGLWDAEVYGDQREKLEPVAKRLGMNWDEYESAADAHLQQIADRGRMAIRLPDRVFPTVLKTGRWKSQYESNRSRGFKDTETRARVEKNLFGLEKPDTGETRVGDRVRYHAYSWSGPEKDLRDQAGVVKEISERPGYGDSYTYYTVDWDNGQTVKVSKNSVARIDYNPENAFGERPIYGYLHNPDLGYDEREESVEQYGDVRVIVKDERRPTTTVTFGDSLDHSGAGNEARAYLGASPMTDVTIISSAKEDPLTEDWPPYGFIENQYMGGLHVGDIAEVHFLRQLPSPATANKLKKLGIPWVAPNGVRSDAGTHQLKGGQLIRIGPDPYADVVIPPMSDEEKAAVRTANYIRNPRKTAGTTDSIPPSPKLYNDDVRILDRAEELAKLDWQTLPAGLNYAHDLPPEEQARVLEAARDRGFPVSGQLAVATRRWADGQGARPLKMPYGYQIDTAEFLGEDDYGKAALKRWDEENPFQRIAVLDQADVWNLAQWEAGRRAGDKYTRQNPPVGWRDFLASKEKELEEASQSYKPYPGRIAYLRSDIQWWTDFTEDGWRWAKLHKLPLPDAPDGTPKEELVLRDLTRRLEKAKNALRDTRERAGPNPASYGLASIKEDEEDVLRIEEALAGKWDALAGTRKQRDEVIRSLATAQRRMGGGYTASVRRDEYRAYTRLIKELARLNAELGLNENDRTPSTPAKKSIKRRVYVHPHQRDGEHVAGYWREEPWRPLTPQEAHAIERYQMFSEESLTEAQKRHLDSAISKQEPLAKKMIVYRGVSEYDTREPGEGWQASAFVSTTRDRSEAQRHNDRVVKIRLPVGARVYDFGLNGYWGTAEVVLPRNAHFRAIDNAEWELELHGAKRRVYVHPHQREGHHVTGFWRDIAELPEGEKEKFPWLKLSEADAPEINPKAYRDLPPDLPRGMAARAAWWPRMSANSFANQAFPKLGFIGFDEVDPELFVQATKGMLRVGHQFPFLFDTKERDYSWGNPEDVARDAWSAEHPSIYDQISGASSGIIAKPFKGLRIAPSRGTKIFADVSPSGWITLNARYWKLNRKTSAKTNELAKGAQEKGFLAKSGDSSDIIVHELGHVMHAWLARNRPELEEELRERIRSRPPVSKYARKNPAEAFAETFAAMMDRQPQQAAVEMAEVLSRLSPMTGEVVREDTPVFDENYKETTGVDPFEGRGVKRRVWVKPHTRHDGVHVDGFWRELGSLSAPDVPLNTEFVDGIRQGHVASDYYKSFAERHRMDVGRYVKAADRQLASAMKDAEVRSRVTWDVLLRILSQKKMKNQFETETSRGMYAPGVRASVENHLFGIDDPSATHADEHPIYGYVVSPRDDRVVDQSWVGMYGDVVLRFKPSVRKRTTFTIGDSLGEELAPSEVEKPGIESTFANVDVLRANVLSDFLVSGDVGTPGATYIEAQIHGGITPDDIAEVSFPRRDARPVEIAALEQAGIPWKNTGVDPLLGVKGEEPWSDSKYVGPGDTVPARRMDYWATFDYRNRRYVAGTPGPDGLLSYYKAPGEQWEAETIPLAAHVSPAIDLDYRHEYEGFRTRERYGVESKRVWVKPHTRRDGVHISGYWRETTNGHVEAPPHDIRIENFDPTDEKDREVLLREVAHRTDYHSPNAEMMNDAIRYTLKGDLVKVSRNANGDLTGAISYYYVDPDDPNMSMPAHEGSVLVSRLGTTPDAPHGTGTDLMREAAREAAKHHAPMILYALPDSRGFYRKLGMHASGRSPGTLSFPFVWRPDEAQAFAERAPVAAAA
jgi:hypothetical protein